MNDLNSKFNTDVVVIYKSATYLTVPCDGNGNILRNPYVNVFRFLNKHLTEWEYDYTTKRSKLKYKYFTYSDTTTSLKLPVNILDKLVDYVRSNRGKCQIVPVTPSVAKDISISSTGNYTDRDHQVAPIEYLISDKPMKCLQKQTGCIHWVGEIELELDGIRVSMSIEDAYNHLKENTYDITRVKSFTGSEFIYHPFNEIVYSGFKQTCKITTANGKSVDLTYDHLVKTPDHWVKAVCSLNEEAVTEGSDGMIANSEIIDIDTDHILNETFDIICDDPHHNFLVNGIVVHNSGKTYIAIRTIEELKKRTLIIVPAFLMSQWIDSISDMTDAKVIQIRGSKSIFQMYTNEFSDDPDIYIASITTLSKYAINDKSYTSLPPFSEFIDKLNVGVKISDECHMNFYANTMIDINCNIAHNIYLSATYIRSSKGSNKIFKVIFPSHVMYDNDEYDKYVNITECEYSVGYIHDKQVVMKRGYSQYKYEQLLMRDQIKLEYLMNDIMIPIINEYYIDKKNAKQKLLIIVGLVDFGTLLVEWLEHAYTNLNITIFVDKTDNKVLEDPDVDVIVSTIGSCGTGRDISNLRTMILFPSFVSEALVRQTLGRLRKLEDTPEFIYLINRGISSHVKHCAVRRPIYKDLGLTFKQVVI